MKGALRNTLIPYQFAGRTTEAYDLVVTTGKLTVLRQKEPIEETFKMPVRRIY